LDHIEVIRKYFPLDKNYILEEAQSASKRKLLLFLVEKVKENYLSQYNPLGLLDDTVVKLNNYQKPNWKNLSDFYFRLAAIYRYKYGENQLKFLFDGSTHVSKYQEEWCNAFKQWIPVFYQSPYFTKAVLELTILNARSQKLHLFDDRLTYFMTNFFELKIYKYRGIMELKAAG